MSNILHLLLAIFLDVNLSNAVVMHSKQLQSEVVGEFDGITRSEFSRQKNPGTALDCQLQCLKDEECMSFFYNRHSGTCQTHDVIFFNPNDGLNSPGSQYYRQVQDFCPSKLDYIYNRALDLCYKLHYDSKVDYSNANQVCRSEDGRLVIVDNVEKLNHLGLTIRASFSTTAYLGFWVGATDTQTEGQWRWSDDQTLPMLEPSYWCPGEPNDFGAGGEDYAEIPVTSDLPVCLNDASAMDPKYFICEIPM